MINGSDQDTHDTLTTHADAPGQELGVERFVARLDRVGVQQPREVVDVHLRDVGDVVDGEDGPCLPTRVGVRVG